MIYTDGKPTIAWAPGRPELQQPRGFNKCEYCGVRFKFKDRLQRHQQVDCRKRPRREVERTVYFVRDRLTGDYLAGPFYAEAEAEAEKGLWAGGVDAFVTKRQTAKL